MKKNMCNDCFEAEFEVKKKKKKHLHLSNWVPSYIELTDLHLRPLIAWRNAKTLCWNKAIHYTEADGDIVVCF